MYYVYYLVCLQNNLLSPFLSGFFGLIGLFLFSFLCVHVFRLIQFGWTYQKGKPAEKPAEKKTEEEEKAPAKQEPVYYIVERKKRRAKSTYSDPKEFRFK